MTIESLSLRTDDGVTLVGERSRPDASQPTVAGAVLCHPHPQFGGSMRAVVISPLFATLPTIGVDCVRFNFRGVEGSQGYYDEGHGEHRDAQAAVAALRADLDPGIPIVMCGFSFGADVALSVTDSSIAGWLAIAPPLRFGAATTDAASLIAAHDPRPKHLILAARDEFREPAEVATLIASWQNTAVDIVAGASHFFVGRTDQLLDVAARFIATLGATPGAA